MRILLVEDNRDILANLADYLGLKGYTVDCAQDGLSGLHLAATEHYDLIVLDIMLPGIDGYTLCKRLREDARRDAEIAPAAPWRESRVHQQQRVDRAGAPCQR